MRGGIVSLLLEELIGFLAYADFPPPRLCCASNDEEAMRGDAGWNGGRPLVLRIQR